MSSLFICNTSSDCISKVNLEGFIEEKRIALSSDSGTKIGPHGICRYNDKLLVANNYSNSLSYIDIKEEREIKNFFIGMHCNDVAVFEDRAYVICGESNSLVVFDLIKSKILEVIPCEEMPHSMTLDRNKKMLVVANMESDSITIFDCRTLDKIKTIKVGAYPTKAIFSTDSSHIYVCESNLGMDSKGSVAVVSLKNYQTIHRISVGNSPVDLYCDEHFCLASNFGDGSISIIYNDYFKEINRITVGGMPRGVIKHGKKIYICDNLNNLLIETDVKIENKKVISIGGEPTGMTLF